MTKIKLFATDVDGTLTDGGMYYGENGIEYKKFNTRDGKGIEFLRNAGIKTAIITSEDTKIVENRAKKLKIDFLSMKNQQKLEYVKKLCADLQISLSEVAYIGDDVNDFDLLNAVGYKACPADAVDKVKSVEKVIVLNKKGGEGAVREFVELILGEKLE